ncbi:retrovirus-related pol polyprotein from transposon TNT 1-94, partial [Tanacetum coccineum]
KTKRSRTKESEPSKKSSTSKESSKVAETFDWDEEEVFDKEEVTQVKVLMALADDELAVGKSYARNGECVNITIRKVKTLLFMDEDADWKNYLKYINIDLKFVEEQRLNLLSKYNKMIFELNKCRDELLILKQAKLDAVTFQIQNTELTKLNHALQEQLKEKKKINEKWLTSSKKKNENENIFVPASMGYDQEMVPKNKDWMERLNPDSKLPNFNTRRVLVSESQDVNESLESTETLNTAESSKDSEDESLTSLPPLKNLHGASPSLEVMPLTFQSLYPKERPGLGIMKHTKPKTQDSLDKSVLGTITVSETESTASSVPTEVKNTKQESKINELTKLVSMLINEKVNPNQMTQESNLQIQQTESSKSVDSLKMSQDSKSKILKAKAKPFPPCAHCGFNDHRFDDCRNYLECGICRSYDHFTSGHNRVIHIRVGMLAESSQSSESSIGVKCNTCGSTIHSTTDHIEFDHFKRETHQGAHLVPEQWMLKEYDWCQELSAQICRATRSQLCDAKYIVQFDDKQGTIFNANKEIILIAPRRNDVYVLDMSSLTPNGDCFFSKASESVNWLWHKRLSHLNFKNINKLAKQNKVLGLPSLVYSKDKPYTACEKGKHHRASFKTKQNFSIRKCLHLLHMDLFGPVSPMSINHEKYTLVIFDKYSRMVGNQNDVKVKQIRTDNEIKFRNHELESIYDEKGISQNFSSPYTPEQNGVAEKKNRTLIEDARTMLNGSVLSKHFWTEAVRTACYTQNRSIIVKRHNKTPYEIFRERIPNISYFHVFGCLVFIHNHKDYLGKFDAKADDGYFLGYSFVSKAFRVFNTRR